MIVAIPLEDGKLCPHFGHCAGFALIQTGEANAIAGRQDAEAPPHEPGALPNWLHDRGVGLVICGGMGSRAIELFRQKGIKVVTGAPVGEPEELVRAYFSGTLNASGNICDH